MSGSSPQNIPASIRQRLLNLARERGHEFQLLLTHYAIERLLYRLCQSVYADQFVLKGAMLFHAWGAEVPRATRDLDLLGQGESSPEAVAKVFREIAQMDVQPDDGIRFETKTLRADPILDGSEYQGVRVRFAAQLDGPRIPVQVDVAFGDAVEPAPESEEYPVLLDLPAPIVRTYARHTVVAEKFQAIVALGMANTRLKDYYDLWRLARDYEFDGTQLTRSVLLTFDRRETVIPRTIPAGLTEEYLTDPSRDRQWRNLAERFGEAIQVPSFSKVGHQVWEFLFPVTVDGFRGHWPAGGPWDKGN